MKFKELPRVVKLRLIESFVSLTVGNMLFPFMIIYFAENFGPKLTGLLLVLNVFCSIAAGFYGGHLADQYGRRRIMLITESVRFGTFIMISLFNSPWMDSVPLTFIMMTVLSICSGIFTPVSKAMLIDTINAENRRYVFSVEYWLSNIAIAIGMVVGGYLFQRYRFELFLCAAGGSFISFYILKYFIKDTHYDKSNAEESSKQSLLNGMRLTYSTVFKDRTFILFVVAELLIISIEFQARNYSGVRLASEMGTQVLFQSENFSFNVDGITMFGYLNSLNAILCVSVGLFLSKIVNRFREKWILFIGVIMYSLFMGVIAVSNTPWLLILSMIIATLGELMYAAIRQPYLSMIPPQNNRSAYMAVYSLVFRGATVIGSFAVTIGAYFPAWIMGSLFVTSGLLGLAIFRTIITRVELRPSPTQAKTV